MTHGLSLFSTLNLIEPFDTPKESMNLLDISFLHLRQSIFPANTLRKSNVILGLHFGNLPKLLSAEVDGT